MGVPAGTPQQAPQVREEIFEAVSAWFRDRQPESADEPVPEANLPEMATPPTGFASPVAAPSPSPATALEWRSAADEGWHAANALRTSVDFEITAAGLPRRTPRAHLVPGAAGPSRLSPPPGSNGLTRTPEDVRGRLTSYQRGLRYGRHARPGSDDQSARNYTGHGRHEEDQQ